MTAGQQVRAWKAKAARPHPPSRPALVASIHHSRQVSGTEGCPWHEWVHSAQHTGGQGPLRASAASLPAPHWATSRWPLNVGAACLVAGFPQVSG